MRSGLQDTTAGAVLELKELRGSQLYIPFGDHVVSFVCHLWYTVFSLPPVMNMSNTPEFRDTAAIDVENEDDIPPMKAREPYSVF
jgi:hypothetical protein